MQISTLPFLVVTNDNSVKKENEMKQNPAGDASYYAETEG